VGGDVSASVSRVALAWLLGRAKVTAAVVSASDPDQIRDSLAAVGTVLSRGHVADLDRASR
jgi:aryl-alcohol dehydrogenase-like predicted oxidoreductase